MGSRVNVSSLDECQQAFDKLKVTFMTVLISAYFNWDNKTFLEIKTEDVNAAGVLLRYDNEGILSVVAFFLKKHSHGETNFEIYDKELMVIVWALEEWTAELSSAEHPVLVISDHQKMD